MSDMRPVTGGGDWSAPPVARIRVTAALEAAMLDGIRYEIHPIIQLQPERKIVGYDLMPIEAVPGPPRPEEGRAT